MPYTPTLWVDEVPASSPVKYKISQTVDGDVATDATIELVTSVTPGTAVNAANLNKLEDGLEAAALVADDAQADATSALATANAAIPKSIVTTIGDLIYATASATLARLAKPAADSVLKMTSGGVPGWKPLSELASSGIYVNVTRALTAQSIPNNTDTNIIFDTEVADTNSFWSAGTPSVITIPQTGYYLINGSILFQSNATGIRYARMSGTGGITDQQVAVSGGYYTYMNFTGIMKLTVSNTITLIAFQSSGGALDVLSASLFISFLYP